MYFSSRYARDTPSFLIFAIDFVIKILIRYLFV